MAFAKGTESTEGAQVKRFIGIASTCIKGVNPSKEELSSFYGREISEEPTYVGENDGVPYVRISFLAEADPEKYPDLNFKTNLSFFLRRTPRVSSAGKKQVIDKYGRTAWATQEEIAAHEIPTYSNGKKANLDAGYRVAYAGEEDLIKFLIAYLNIPAPSNYINGEWVMKSGEELADCEASLEHIEDYFKGNIKELKEIISLQPKNKVKVAYGVRTADDGREYQTFYQRMFLRNNSNDYSRISKDIEATKAAGGLSTSEFDCTEIHEYTVTPTEFKPSGDEELPFEAGDDTKTPWD